MIYVNVIHDPQGLNNAVFRLPLMMAMNEIFPEIHSKVAIAELFPTQVTVGMREVDIRRLSWREKSIDKAVQYLGSHRVPVVIGPNNRHYMVDRHHLTTALYEEGMSEVPVSIIGDFNKLGLESFWTIMESRNWTHPFDDEGHRCPFDSMPTTVANLTDDPFRSLAGAVKRAQGYAKNKAPFSEFRWETISYAAVSPVHWSNAISAAPWPLQ